MTREEHDRDIATINARIDRTESLLIDRFSPAIDRLDDHLRAQDKLLLGILGSILATIIAFAVLRFLHVT